ncbi:MAG: hypothetical protein B7Y42_14695, partial [Polaromonas sp. 28-63-22]
HHERGGSDQQMNPGEMVYFLQVIRKHVAPPCWLTGWLARGKHRSHAEMLRIAMEKPFSGSRADL